MRERPRPRHKEIPLALCCVEASPQRAVLVYAGRLGDCIEELSLALHRPLRDIKGRLESSEVPPTCAGLQRTPQVKNEILFRVWDAQRYVTCGRDFQTDARARIPWALPRPRSLPRSSHTDKEEALILESRYNLWMLFRPIMPLWQLQDQPWPSCIDSIAL